MKKPHDNSAIPATQSCDVVSVELDGSLFSWDGKRWTHAGQDIVPPASILGRLRAIRKPEIPTVEYVVNRLAKLLAAVPPRRPSNEIGNLIWKSGPVDARYELYSSAYLGSPYWHAFREAVLEKIGKRCELCDETDGIELHHLSYARLGGEHAEDVAVLCHTCHDDAHCPGANEVSSTVLDRRRKRGLSQWKGPNVTGRSSASHPRGERRTRF